MTSWDYLFRRKDNAVGEVAGIESSKIEIYVYPEHFDKIRIGSIFLINSDDVKPIGLVLRLAHTSRYGSFTPMRMTRSEIQRAYPDLEKYHMFVSTIIYTSHLGRDQKIRHFRASAPRLHDLVYLVNDKELLDAFFRPEMWDFNFLRYFFDEGAGVLEFRDFLYTYKEYFQSREAEKEEILEAMINSLLTSSVDLRLILQEIGEILGW
ncbi:MAG: hypothetical protein DRZ80_05480 [Thermoprotei archaeon]|nr:MAG: hypothetical protein DRZ80_05480 [Thermoprotei archaeon]